MEHPKRPKHKDHEGCSCLLFLLSLVAGAPLYFFWPKAGAVLLLIALPGWLHFGFRIWRDGVIRRRYDRALAIWCRSITPPTGQAWRLLLDAEGLTTTIEELAPKARWAVAADFADGRSVRSHFGGVPSVPEDFVWPVDGEGRPMEFLANVALEELPAGPEELPRAGTLQFFATIQDGRVYLHDAAADLVRAQPPRSPSKRVTKRPLVFRCFEDIPTSSGNAEATTNAIWDAQEYLRGKAFTMLGADRWGQRAEGHVPFVRFHAPNITLPFWGGTFPTELHIAVRDLAAGELSRARMIHLSSRERMEVSDP